jgi:hypothetical protein
VDLVGFSITYGFSHFIPRSDDLFIFGVRSKAIITKTFGALGLEHYGTLAANAQIGVVKLHYAVSGNGASKLN